MDRRYFLKSSGITLASFGLMAVAPRFLHQFANAQTLTDKNGKKKILITIFQRGAVDGLNMVVPYGDGEYYDLRRNIAIPKPNETDGAVNLDGYFGLHPSLKPFETFWQNKQLAVVHSSARPTIRARILTRRIIWNPARRATRARATAGSIAFCRPTQDEKDSPFRAVSMTQQTPRSLLGRAPTIAMTNLSDFAIKAGVYTEIRAGRL